MPDQSLPVAQGKAVAVTRGGRELVVGVWYLVWTEGTDGTKGTVDWQSKAVMPENSTVDFENRTVNSGN